MKSAVFAMMVLAALIAQPQLTNGQSDPNPAGTGVRRVDSLNKVQILALLAGDVTSERLATLVQRYGIAFSTANDYLESLRKGGATDELVEAVRNAKVAKALEDNSAREAHPASIQQRLLTGTELKRNKRFTEAEKEYRAALQLEPQNSALHLCLGNILAVEGLNNYAEAISQLQEAVRLDPGDADAHRLLGVVLLADEAPHPAVPEFRELVRLEPNDPEAHWYLASVLLMTRELDRSIVEYREALRLKPDYFEAHVGLAGALMGKKDASTAIGELYEALRLRPDHAETHFDLASVLEDTGEKNGALEQYRVAHELEPSNSLYGFRYERLSRELGILTTKEKL